MNNNLTADLARSRKGENAMAKEPIAPSPPDGSPREPVRGGAPAAEAVPRIVGGSLEARPVNDHAAEAVLDKLNRGIVIFDPEGRVHFLNDAAMRVIRETNTMQVTEGRLVFAEAGTQSRFSAYLTRCLERSDGGADQSSVVMRIESGSHVPPFRVLLSPLRTPASPATGSRDSRHVLMIYEPNAGLRLPKRILTELYSLSEAEATLTLLLFAGESLETAAQHLHISVNTAKTHLHHIFLKCDVHSQGELLQLLSLGPRTL
jgi:DNA-binding CsgD family transcriptional regulator